MRYSLEISVFLVILTLVNNAKLEPRIAGGSDAKPKSAPYIVSIQVKTAQGAYQHTCGGSIIDEHWILTAAHCIPASLDLKKLRIEAGRYNLKNNENDVQERSVDYIKVHKLYVGGTAPYDIALIYTKQGYIWSNTVQPISLPSAGKIPSGKTQLFGWGSTSKTAGVNSFPDVLQTADLELITFAECEKILGKDAINLHETNVCTISPPEGIGICNADSGGPLAQKSQGKNELIGIVSWGQVPCGKPHSASIYARVSAFIGWINDVKKEFEQNKN